MMPTHHLPNLADASSRLFITRARYDAAQTTDENRKHWAAADAYDADACNNVAVRTILRNRARYVFANNPRARGMIKTLAVHTVGTGPRLQMDLGPGKQALKLNDQIEAEFRSWAREIKLAKKLRIIRIAKVISGEIFGLLIYNPRLTSRIKLDLRLIECDQITNPNPTLDPRDIDGVRIDEVGNPESYSVLRYHPGSLSRSYNPNDYIDVSGRMCLHYFEADRPGQHRGIPEITPAVQLVEEGRRFRAAVLGAAETAADFAMALETESPADSDEVVSTVAAMDTMELPRRLATVLPGGFKLSQTKAEQPTTTFKEFSRELLGEVARCLQMPISIATLDANDANMSSSYVINQPYEKAIDVERSDLASEILDPLLDMWLMMAFDPMAPLARRTPSEFPHLWYWPRIGNHADPGKVATAQATKLLNHTTTLEREWALEGEDWEAALRQRAIEAQRLKELNLTPQQALPSPNQATPNGAIDEDDEDADEE